MVLKWCVVGCQGTRPVPKQKGKPSALIKEFASLQSQKQCAKLSNILHIETFSAQPATKTPLCTIPTKLAQAVDGLSGSLDGYLLRPNLPSPCREIQGLSANWGDAPHRRHVSGVRRLVAQLLQKGYPQSKHVLWPACCAQGWAWARHSQRWSWHRSMLRSN